MLMLNCILYILYAIDVDVDVDVDVELHTYTIVNRILIAGRAGPGGGVVGAGRGVDVGESVGREVGEAWQNRAEQASHRWGRGRAGQAGRGIIAGFLLLQQGGSRHPGRQAAVVA